MATRVLTVPTELAEKVDAAARKLDRPADAIVEEALSDWLSAEAWKHEATLKGLADSAAGRVVSHDRVVEWMESLGTDSPLPRPRPLPQV